MKNILEGIMLISFCFAAVVLIFRFAKNKSQKLKLDRGIAVSMCIGFIFGAVGKIMVHPVEWTFAFYVVGAYLFYTATLLSFPNLGKNLEGNLYE